MPQTKSHIKNIKIILRNRNSNKKYKLAIKKATKKYFASVESINNDKQHFKKCFYDLSFVYKAIDKAVSKKVLHKNTASRKKSRLAKALNKHYDYV